MAVATLAVTSPRMATIATNAQMMLGMILIVSVDVDVNNYGNVIAN